MDTLTGGPSRPQVLALTPDPDLAGCVRRAAAAADRDVHELAAPVPRRTWIDATGVVLDTTAAHDCAAAGLPRRSGVHLVCSAPPGLVEWRAAAAVGAESVLTLPSGEADLVAVLARHVESRAAGAGTVVAVIGGRGGAGASTLSAALALTCPSRHPGRRALLVDCDPRGGGLDLLVGAEHRPGLRWRSLVVEGGAVSADALHGALPAAGDGVSVLSCLREDGAREPGAAALTAVIEAGRAAGDLVVCDVPRQAGGTAEVALGLADLVVVLVRAQVRAVAAAQALMETVRGVHPNVVAVVRGPAPGGLRGPDIARMLDVPLLATMRPETGLDTALERGGLRLGRRSPLRRVAGTILDVLDTGGIAA